MYVQTIPINRPIIGNERASAKVKNMSSSKKKRKGVKTFRVCTFKGKCNHKFDGECLWRANCDLKADISPDNGKDS